MPTKSLGGMGQAGSAEGLEGTKFSFLGARSCSCSHGLCSEEPHSQSWFNTFLHSPPWLPLRMTEQNCLYHKIQCVGRGLCAWIFRLNTQRWHTEQGGHREAGDDPQWQRNMVFSTSIMTREFPSCFACKTGCFTFLSPFSQKLYFLHLFLW